MTMKELEKRLAALEAEVKELRGRLAAPQSGSWIDTYGKYRHDPELAAAAAEADRLARERREQQRQADMAEFDRQQAESARVKTRTRKPTAKKRAAGQGSHAGV
jgi:hypothetical protein